MDRRHIAIIVAIVVVGAGLAVWALWPTSDEPDGSAPERPVATQTGTPTTEPTVEPTTEPEEPTVEPTAETTEPEEPTTEPEPTTEHDYTLPEYEMEPLPSGNRSERAVGMSDAAVNYLITLHTLDYGTEFPGRDMQKLLTLSTGLTREGHEIDAMDWEHPRPSDLEDYNRMNEASGGRYQQSVEVHLSWPTEAAHEVVVDISTTNSLGEFEMVEETFTLSMEECDTNPHGWCVANAEQTEF